jgi:hypothetical protein
VSEQRDGRPALVRVDRLPALPAALDAAGLPRGCPVLVLVGGAGGMADHHLETVRFALRDGVLPALDERGAAVVDGGTDSGVMRVIGRVRAAAAGPDAAEIETHHTHVVLVPGTEWGDEAPWLAEVADVIAAGRPSVTVLVNGGEIAYDDTFGSLARRRPVVVLAGTGRTADAIAAARGGGDADARAVRIAGSELTRIVPVEDVAGIRAAVTAALA